MVSALSWCTWRLFGTASDIYGIGIGLVRPNLQYVRSTTDKTLWLGTAVTCMLPLYMVSMYGLRQKEFDKGDNDEVVVVFGKGEGSMAFRSIFISYNTHITKLSLLTISTRCVWITSLAIMDCKGVDADVAIVALLLNLRKLELTGTPVKGE